MYHKKLFNAHISTIERQNSVRQIRHHTDVTIFTVLLGVF